MTKVIVSHDVDHLFAGDHWFRDLIYPKMWVRTTLQFLKRQITAKEWWLRNTSCFRKNRHNIDALMDFDEQNGIPSTFFFGMKQGLGMSYKPAEAKPVIMKVHDRGFSAGVHGIEYQDIEGMKEEYNTFRQFLCRWYDSVHSKWFSIQIIMMLNIIQQIQPEFIQAQIHDGDP